MRSCLISKQHYEDVCRTLLHIEGRRRGEVSAFQFGRFCSFELGELGIFFSVVGVGRTGLTRLEHRFGNDDALGIEVAVHRKTYEYKGMKTGKRVRGPTRNRGPHGHQEN
jgi:hypothetical protein